VTVKFTEDVSGGLAANALSLVNLSGGPVPSMTFSWDLATLTGTWQFSQPLADGNYRATLDGDSVHDWSGALVDGNRDSLPGGDYDFDFFSLAGDANGDRSVDFLDLAKLAQNYNTSSGGLTYADGDFNGDGSVDFLDLAKLAQNYNTNLPASPAAGPVPIAGAAAMPSLASVIAQVSQPTAPVPTPVMVTMVEAGAKVVRVASGIVLVHPRSRSIVHLRLVIVVIARLVVAPLHDALALDNACRMLNVGLALFVPTQVRSRCRVQGEPDDAASGNSAQQISHG